MGWIPDDPWDAFWFTVAPITTAPTFVYGAAGYVTDEYPLGKPDWRANVRNTLLWTGAAATVYGWNLAMSPHNAIWTSGSHAWRTLLHLGGVPLATVAVTAAVGAGYVATADVHGGAFSVPGGSMSYGPGIYGSDPMGEFEEGVREFFSWFGF